MTLAEALATDIAVGRLKSGHRLPPQRQFAYERGIAISTASRVYAELFRRGLIVGEVGRGSFVAARAAPNGSSMPEPTGSRVDLEFNFPILPEQPRLLAKSLASLSRPDALADALRYTPPQGTLSAREISARFLARGGWLPKPESFLFAGNGRQAIASAIGALVPMGARLGVEAITYPAVKRIAARLGITLVPLAMDEQGIRPDAISKAHREAPLSAVYIQPALHNPLGVTLSRRRREDLSSLAGKLDLIMIEDAVYAFLCDEPPLAALAPEHCVVIDSLSKRVAPGLALGFISAPSRIVEGLMASVRSGGWTASGWAFEYGQQLMADGTAAAIAIRKREDAKQRQRIAAECLSGFSIHADHRTYHLWLVLPEQWRSETFVAAAARDGIALTPSSTFTVCHGHAPNAVRLALASPPIEQLREALLTVAKLLRSGAEAFDITE